MSFPEHTLFVSSWFIQQQQQQANPIHSPPAGSFISTHNSHSDYHHQQPSPHHPQVMATPESYVQKLQRTALSVATEHR
jgi:hypothetical protein